MRVNLLGGAAHWSELSGVFMRAEQSPGVGPRKRGLTVLPQGLGRLRNSNLEPRAEIEARQDVLKYITADERQADGGWAVGHGNCEIGHLPGYEKRKRRMTVWASASPKRSAYSALRNVSNWAFCFELRNK